jgi:hypothetical protein
MSGVFRNLSRFSDESSEKLGEEFIKHKKTIESIVGWYHYRYGADYDSLYAAAVGRLMSAYNNYDPLRSEWEKYLSIQIHYSLRTVIGNNAKKKFKCSTNIDDSFLEVPVESCDGYYNIEELKENLTPDAQYVLKCVLESDKNTVQRRMNAVQQRTLSMGWSRRRTKAAFAELRCMIEADM